jgi:hypothetical protein
VLWVTFRSLGAQAAGPVLVGTTDGDFAAGPVLAGAAGLEELAGLAGAGDELDDDPQPAASAAQASTAATHPARAAVTRPPAGFSLPERPASTNTAVPPLGAAPRAPSRKV